MENKDESQPAVIEYKIPPEFENVEAEEDPISYLFGVMTGELPNLHARICKDKNDVILRDYATAILTLRRRIPAEYRIVDMQEAQEAAEVLDFAREFMRTLYEQKGITVAQLEHLTELGQRFTYKLVSAIDAEESEGIIHTGNFYEVVDGGIFAELSANIVRFLHKLAREDYNLLMQCPECKTLFVQPKDRPTQVFDCDSCRNKYNVRKSREKKQKKNLDNSRKA